MVRLKSRALAPNTVPKNKHTNLGNLKAESFRKKQPKNGLNANNSLAATV